MVEEHQLVTRQKAFVLLQVFTAPDRRLTQSALSKKFSATTLKSFGTSKAAMEAVRDDLIQGGYLKPVKGKRAAYLEVTDKGLSLLLASPQYPSIKITISGEALTYLLTSLEEMLLGENKVGSNGVNPAVARALMKGIYTDTLRDLKGLFESAHARLLKVFGDDREMSGASILPAESDSPKLIAAASEPPEIEPPTEAELKEEIVKAFEYLLREKYTQGEMVPIHAVRHWVAERLGEEAASHAVFDPAVKQLSSQRRVRLVSISDRRDVTDDEINASIPGANETFFYLKVAHEHAHA